MHIIDPILTFVHHNPLLSYAAIFLISLSESLAVVGLFIPGTVVMFGIGALVGAGTLELTPVLLMAIAGAVAGDAASYWLGHYYREDLQRIWPFYRYPRILENGKQFFFRHGGKSVLIGRFVGPVRPIIPVVAGILNMRPLHFTIVNVLSAIGWALAYTLPGVFFGTSLVVAGAVSTRLVLLLFLVVVTSWCFLWIGSRIIYLIQLRGPIMVSALKEWIAAKSPAHEPFVTLSRLFSFLFQHQYGEETLFVASVLVLFAAGWFFLVLWQHLLAQDLVQIANQYADTFFQSLRTPWADSILVPISELGDAFVTLCFALAIFPVLLIKRCYRSSLFWAISLLSVWVSIQGMLWAGQASGALFSWDCSFHLSSGNTLMNVVLYGFGAVLISQRLSSARRWGVFTVLLLVSFALAASRLYLGAEHFTTLVAEFFIGTSWAGLLSIAYLKRADQGIPRRLVASTALVAIILAGAWHTGQCYQKDLAAHVPQRRVQDIALDSWLENGWRLLPAFRIDMEGELEQPLTLQWADSRDALMVFLLGHGWHRAPALGLNSFMAMLSPDTSIEKLPVLPRLHNGRIDTLRLIRMQNGQRWVLRLWPSGFEIGGSRLPILIGTIEVQQRRHLTWLITAAPVDTKDYDTPYTVLEEMLRNQFNLRTVQWAGSEIGETISIGGWNWNGRGLLIWEDQNSGPKEPMNP